MDLELEDILSIELERLEQMFFGELPPSDCVHNQNDVLARYKLAESEGDMEQLEDRLHELLSKTDDYDIKFYELNQRNFELTSQNQKLSLENRLLKSEVSELNNRLECLNRHQRVKVESSHSDIEFREMEFKLAETRSKLARTLQTFDDLTLAKDYAIKQLEQERLTRIHVEKERDAYSAAYEASLTHFDKWSKSKQHQSSH